MRHASYEEGSARRRRLAGRAGGVIFTLQGSGGGAMAGVTFWAVAGPVIALAGLVMAALGLRGGRVRPGRHDQARSGQA